MGHTDVMRGACDRDVKGRPGEVAGITRLTIVPSPDNSDAD
jgi:hypothetical protein